MCQMSEFHRGLTNIFVWTSQTLTNTCCEGLSILLTIFTILYIHENRFGTCFLEKEHKTLYISVNKLLNFFTKSTYL